MLDGIEVDGIAFSVHCGGGCDGESVDEGRRRITMVGGLGGCSFNESGGRYHQGRQAFVGVLMLDGNEVDCVAHGGDGGSVGHGRRRATMVAGQDVGGCSRVL